MSKFNTPIQLNEINSADNTDQNNPVPVKRRRGRPLGAKQIPIKRTKRPKGRPDKYNLKVSNLICEYLSVGIPLTQICRMEGMPSYPTVMAWLWRESSYKEDFLNRYQIARQQQADFMADEMVEIADNGTNDWYERKTKDNRVITVLNNDNVQRSRLRVDTRKWIAAKLQPKKYGEKTEVTGKDGQPLLPQGSTRIVFDFTGEAE